MNYYNTIIVQANNPTASILAVETATKHLDLYAQYSSPDNCLTDDNIPVKITGIHKDVDEEYEYTLNVGNSEQPLTIMDIHTHQLALNHTVYEYTTGHALLLEALITHIGPNLYICRSWDNNQRVVYELQNLTTWAEIYNLINQMQKITNDKTLYWSNEQAAIRSLKNNSRRYRLEDARKQIQLAENKETTPF